MRPETFRHVLGETFVRTSGEIVLTLGPRRYDRFRLGEIGIPQIKAARTLDLVLQRLAIKSPEALADRIDELTSLEGVGHAAFYAALAVLADCDREGRALEEYTRAAKGKIAGHDFVMFSTLKARARSLRAKHSRPRRRAR
jgi:hypothetical protein